MTPTLRTASRKEGCKRVTITGVHIPWDGSAAVQVRVDERRAESYYPFVQGGPVEAGHLVIDGRELAVYVNSRYADFDESMTNHRASALFDRAGVRTWGGAVKGDALVVCARGDDEYERSVPPEVRSILTNDLAIEDEAGEPTEATHEQAHLDLGEDQDPWAGLVDFFDGDDDDDDGDEPTLQSLLVGMSAPDVLDVALGRSWDLPDFDDRIAAIQQLLWQDPARAAEALLTLGADADLDQSDRRSVVEIAISVGPALGLAVVWVFEQTIASQCSSEDWLERHELRPEAPPHHWLAAYAVVMRNEQLDIECRAEAAARLWFESKADAALRLVLDAMPHRLLAYALYEQDQKQSPYAAALLDRLAESEEVPWAVRVDAAEWLLDEDDDWQTTGERVMLDLLRSESAPGSVRARALEALRATGRPNVLASVIDPTWEADELLAAPPDHVIEQYLAPFDAVVLRAVAAESSMTDDER